MTYKPVKTFERMVRATLKTSAWRRVAPHHNPSYEGCMEMLAQGTGVADWRVGSVVFRLYAEIPTGSIVVPPYLARLCDYECEGMYVEGKCTLRWCLDIIGVTGFRLILKEEELVFNACSTLWPGGDPFGDLTFEQEFGVIITLRDTRELQIEEEAWVPSEIATAIECHESEMSNPEPWCPWPNASMTWRPGNFGRVKVDRPAEYSFTGEFAWPGGSHQHNFRSPGSPGGGDCLLEDAWLGLFQGGWRTLSELYPSACTYDPWIGEQPHPQLLIEWSAWCNYAPGPRVTYETHGVFDIPNKVEEWHFNVRDGYGRVMRTIMPTGHPAQPYYYCAPTGADYIYPACEVEWKATQGNCGGSRDLPVTPVWAARYEGTFSPQQSEQEEQLDKLVRRYDGHIEVGLGWWNPLYPPPPLTIYDPPPDTVGTGHNAWCSNLPVTNQPWHPGEPPDTTGGWGDWRAPTAWRFGIGPTPLFDGVWKALRMHQHASAGLERDLRELEEWSSNGCSLEHFANGIKITCTEPGGWAKWVPAEEGDELWLTKTRFLKVVHSGHPCRVTLNGSKGWTLNGQTHEIDLCAPENAIGAEPNSCEEQSYIDFNHVYSSPFWYGKETVALDDPIFSMCSGPGGSNSVQEGGYGWGVDRVFDLKIDDLGVGESVYIHSLHSVWHSPPELLLEPQAWGEDRQNEGRTRYFYGVTGTEEHPRFAYAYRLGVVVQDGRVIAELLSRIDTHWTYLHPEYGLWCLTVFNYATFADLAVLEDNEFIMPARRIEYEENGETRFRFEPLEIVHLYALQPDTSLLLNDERPAMEAMVRELTTRQAFGYVHPDWPEKSIELQGEFRADCWGFPSYVVHRSLRIRKLWDAQVYGILILDGKPAAHIPVEFWGWRKYDSGWNFERVARVLTDAYGVFYSTALPHCIPGHEKLGSLTIKLDVPNFEHTWSVQTCQRTWRRIVLYGPGVEEEVVLAGLSADTEPGSERILLAYTFEDRIRLRTYQPDLGTHATIEAFQEEFAGRPSLLAAHAGQTVDYWIAYQVGEEAAVVKVRSSADLKTWSDDGIIAEGEWPCLTCDQETGIVFLFYSRAGELYLKRRVGGDWEAERHALSGVDGPACCRVRWDSGEILLFVSQAGNVKAYRSANHGVNWALMGTLGAGTFPTAVLDKANCRTLAAWIDGGSVKAKLETKPGEFGDAVTIASNVEDHPIALRNVDKKGTSAGYVVYYKQTDAQLAMRRSVNGRSWR